MYNIEWARKVVSEHYKTYARVSYFLLTNSTITTEQLAVWLAKNDIRWNLWKNCVARLLLASRARGIELQMDLSPTQLYSIWCEKLLEMLDAHVCKDLTPQIWRLTLEKQVLSTARSASRSRRGPSVPDLPGQLLPFEEVEDAASRVSESSIGD